MNLDMTKLEPLLGTVVNELGAASNAALVILGDKLGLFRALSERAMTPSQLAQQTGTHERLVREWLSAQAASGYVSYDTESARFSMTPEQAFVFADEDSPVFMAGGFDAAAGGLSRRAEVAEAFQTRQGRRVGASTATACSAASSASSVPATTPISWREWLPALDGVVEKLEHGAKVADVGCGHGVSTILMAQAFPKSTVHRLRLS